MMFKVCHMMFKICHMMSHDGDHMMLQDHVTAWLRVQQGQRGFGVTGSVVSNHCSDKSGMRMQMKMHKHINGVISKFNFVQRIMNSLEHSREL